MDVKSARFVVSAQDPSSYPEDGLPQIAVAGRSNVGKSSLLNLLMMRKKLVKTSSTPGKTRLINFFLVNEGDPAKAFYLVDIPGFGYAQKGGDAKRDMEKALEAYFNRGKALKGLLYLIDSRISGSEVDDQAIEWLSEFGFPLLVVATKADKLKRQELAKSLQAIAERHGLPQPPIAVSSHERTGRDEVLEQVSILLSA